MILEIRGGPLHGSKLNLEGLDVPDFLQFAFKDLQDTEHFDRYATYRMRKGAYRLVAYTDQDQKEIEGIPRASMS